MQPGIGVFGTGTTVRCLVPILKTSGFKVQALWGRTKDLAEEAAKDLNVPISTSNVDEVLLHKDVDLVFISCPPHLQPPIAVKALGIGKHVICGTPAGPGQIDALRMVFGARYYPSLMSLMCYGLRFLPAFSKMRNLISDGYIGDFLACEVRVHCGSMVKDEYDWMCDELMGGGVLNTIGGSIIDIVSYVTKQKAVSVHGLLKTFTKQTAKVCGIRQISSDDFCNFQMEMESGSCVIVTLNNHIPGQFCQEVIVCGSKGRLISRGADLYGIKNDAYKEELLYHDPMNILDAQKSSVSENIRADIPIPYLKGLIGLIDAVKDAFKSVEDRHKWSEQPVLSAANFEDALYIQTVIDAVRKSSKTKEWIRIKIMDEEPDPNPFLSAAIRRSTFSLYT